MCPVRITSYKKEYSKAFYELNKDWISQFWVLEESDLQTLLSPEKSIINLGGEVFFVIIQNKPIGTVAMIPTKEGVYELAKMTIQAKYRGRGFSKMLLEKCIDFAKGKNAKEIFLISNRLLTTARNLYDKYGFIEVPLDSRKYDRGDVKMVLKI